MVKSKPKTIEEILGKFEPEKMAIAQKLRALVKTVVPDASEIVRRGVITYVLKDKDFASIHLFKSHVDLGLLAGAQFDDKRLKGTGAGKDVRHVKVVSLKNVDEPEITRLLKEAATLT